MRLTTPFIRHRSCLGQLCTTHVGLDCFTVSLGNLLCELACQSTGIISYRQAFSGGHAGELQLLGWFIKALMLVQ